MAVNNMGKSRKQQNYRAFRVQLIPAMTKRGKLWRGKKSGQPVFRAVCGAAFFLLCAFLFTCGIDEYAFLEKPGGVISVTGDTQASVAISHYTSTYFTNYMIYYRIYLSNHPPSGGFIPEVTYQQINPQLAADYSALYPYTDNQNTTVSLTNISYQFSARNYYAIAFPQGSPNVLGNPASADTLIMDFAPTAGTWPEARLVNGNISALMWRSRGGNSTDTVLPTHRYFQNDTGEITTTTPTITPPVNRDVQPISGSASYAYVALYIVASGITSDLAPLYSRPAFIGVFALRP